MLPPSPPIAAGLPAPSEGWKVGVHLSLSGPAAALGVQAKEGIELAVDELNQAGGPRNGRIHLIYADDASSPNEAESKVRSLVERGRDGPRRGARPRGRHASRPGQYLGGDPRRHPGNTGSAGRDGKISIDASRDVQKDVLILRFVSGKPAYHSSVKLPPPNADGHAEP